MNVLVQGYAQESLMSKTSTTTKKCATFSNYPAENG